MLADAIDELASLDLPELEREIVAMDRKNGSESFRAFVKMAWPVLEPSTSFISNWHIECICLPYSSTIIRRTVSYRITTQDGYTLLPTTSPDKFAFYEFSGPAIRKMSVTEDREELVADGASAKAITDAEKSSPGAVSGGLGNSWRRISHDPQCEVKTLGLGTSSK